MSDRDDERDQALDPPENTGGGNAMSLDSAEEEPASALDPPENTKQDN
jgi:hypothetical protein